MKKRIAMLSMLVFASAALFAAETAEIQPYYGKIATRLAAMLPRNHVLQQRLDDMISQRAWTNLVTYYDADHSVFLKSDLDALAEREKTLDNELKRGDVSFGFDVYNLFIERFNERYDFATNLLAAAEWDFTSNEVYRIKRKDAPWPETREDAEDLWRKKIKNEVLVQMLSRELDIERREAKSAEAAEAGESEEADDEESGEDGEGETEERKPDTPEEHLLKKYRQYAVEVSEPDAETILQNYLDSVTRAYDPHSGYMSQSTKKEFDMEMNLALAGVGAELGADDGALKVGWIVPDGPMALDGRIKSGDKIVGIKQEDGELEDIMWQPIKKSINKIRGPKGTRVTLEIMPKSDPTGKTRKMVELVRDIVKLEDQAATGRVERVELGGVEHKLGYVYLPSFYGTMDKPFGDPDYRSCALDVNRLIADFNAEDVEGLVLDLRGNGGGSLREAVMLSALFVERGPVVQIRDTRTVVSLPIPPGNPVAFKKPVVVLTDRASASASEIVAGHLQDVGRAVVIGDSRTHGKGTVQSVLGIGPNGIGPEKYGATKITTARFYRVNGRSTQTEGVEPDIRLPSLLDSLDIGEDKLPNALPFSRILPADYDQSWNLGSYVNELKALSDARLEDDERYRKHIESVDGMLAISEREVVPLERDARKAMMKSDRELRELDDGDDEEKEAEIVSRRRNQRKKDDVVLDESFRILADLVRLTDGAELPVRGGLW
ncbi:MAG: carboxy terminal-processing peptidase [Kiritimatiellae bacterium]|nr:carboxy terminal-processing peptidase [Kiritimatiellia bacterium]